MARGDPPTSPWQFYDSGGDYQGNHIRASVTFAGTITRGSDPSTWTNALTGATVTRDAGCVYTKILIGTLDANGQPTGQTRTINVAGLSGARSFTQAQLNAVGLVAVNDIFGFQITAAP